MRHVVAFALLFFFAVSVARPARANEDSDTARTILLFVVNPPEENAKKGVISWIQSFKNSVRYLLDDFSSGQAATIKVLVNTQNVDDIDQDMLEASWRRQPSLQVLSTIGRYAGQSTFVENDIYLGDLKGSLPIPYVHISQEVLPGRYKITREALAVVTLYAYAMAVAQTFPGDSNRFIVCNILDRANMYKHSDLDPEARNYLEKIFKAISAELEARACGGKK